jgi:hypothetical protein
MGVRLSIWSFQVRYFRIRRRYFTAAGEARTAFESLTASPDAYGRMLVLFDLADQERAMAETAYAFADAKVRDEDGFTLAASHDLAARLLVMLACTEGAVCVDEGAHLAVPSPHNQHSLAGLPLPPAASTLLAGLATTPQPMKRARLTLALRNALVDLVGTQAGEALAGAACAYFQLAGLSHQDAAHLVGSFAGGEPR